MKDIFNFDRFSKFLAYDLNKATASYGISLLVCGLIPVVLFFFTGICYLIFEGHWSVPDPEMTVVLLFVALLIVIISAPTKIYGSITDKKTGSDYLMIPASAFEKFLSMMIVLCVVLPVAFFFLFFFSDWVLSVTLGSYEPILLPKIKSLLGNNVIGGEGFMTVSNVSLVCLLWAEWSKNILIFALGALLFKKSKPAKTILALIIISMVFSTIVALIFNGLDVELIINDDFIQNMKANPQFIFNAIVNSYYIVLICGLAAAIFFRIKSLKH